MQNDNDFESNTTVIIVLVIILIIIQFFTIIAIIQTPGEEMFFPNINKTLSALEGKIFLLVTYELCYSIVGIISWELGKATKRSYWWFRRMALPNKKRQSKK